MVIDIHAMGDYWQPDRAERTELGELIHAAKDRRDAAATAGLEALLAAWARRLALPARGLLVAVPASPDRPNPILDDLYRRFAATAGLTAAPTVVRHRSTQRLRDLEPAARPAVAQAAGYEVLDGCAGRPIVLIDDVVLTGTTLHHVGGLLLDAGATSVIGLALARSRRGETVSPSRQ